jgi:hypothetical protein
VLGKLFIAITPKPSAQSTEGFNANEEWRGEKSTSLE